MTPSASPTRTSPPPVCLLSCGLCAFPSHLGARVCSLSEEGSGSVFVMSGGRSKVNSYYLMSFYFVLASCQELTLSRNSQ